MFGEVHLESRLDYYKSVLNISSFCSAIPFFEVGRDGLALKSILCAVKDSWKNGRQKSWSTLIT